MVFAAHWKVTMNGTLGNAAGGPVERFSMGVCMETAFAPGSVSDADPFWSDVKNDCVAFFGRAETSIHAAAKLTEVKIARIGADGKYTQDPRIYAVSQAGGATAGGLHPPQCSLVVSMTSGRRGPSGKGRFYLPLPAVTLDPATMVIADAQRDAIAGSAQTFLNNLNDAVALDVVTGPVVVIASTKGFNTPVTGVRVGQAIDTVRSRRRSLKEAFDAPLPVS